MAPKKTAFTDIHRTLGAKIVEFAGYEMPVQYSGILEEHRLVRTAVGLFDVSHMGEFEISGRDALRFVQLVTVNDASRLQEGRVQYSAMCYDGGGIVDDLLVYHLGDHYMFVVNAANIDKDFSWLEAHRSGDVVLKNMSDEFSLLAVQGPKSLATVQPLTSADLSGIAYYHSIHATVAGIPMIVSRTGYTGELGFELYFPADPRTGEAVWGAIMDAGRGYAIAPVGLGARDTLRLEMGYCLYGHDIDQTTNPLEAGLGWITKLDKGDFLGKPAITAAKAAGLRRRLVGFSLADNAVPRQGYPLHAGGRRIGAVTSGTYSPSLEKGIGMGYVELSSAAPGSEISVQIRGRESQARVLQLPFIKKP